MYKLIFRCLILIVVGIAGSLAVCADPTSSAPKMLSEGFLSVRGSQIVGSDSVPVRLACVGLNGMDNCRRTHRWILDAFAPYFRTGATK